MPEVTEFETVIRALHGSGVRFVLIGGVAMQAHGSSYLTDDLDACYARQPDNFERLVKALAPLRPRLRGVNDDLPFTFDERTLAAGLNFTLMTDAGAVDLLGEAAGAPEFDRLYEQAVTMELYGCSVKVASLDDLISMKKAAGRPKDLVQAAELQALREMCKGKEDSG